MDRRPKPAVLATLGTFSLAAVVGAFGGVVAIVFQELVDLAVRGVTGSDAPYLEALSGLAGWQRILWPVLGGVAAALFIRLFAQHARPFGIAGILEVVSLRKLRIRTKPIVVRSAAAIGVLASGGSVGREGPIVQLASAMASQVARTARLDARAHSVLIGCGVAAGMAAAYNAPLTGAFFVMEVILASFAIDVFGPLVVSSVFAVLVMRGIRGADAAVYAMPSEIALVGVVPMLAALVLGACSGVLAVSVQRLLRGANQVFGRLTWPLEAKLALGGLCVGLFAFYLPEVSGNGYGATSAILAGQLSLTTIALLLIAKPLATAASIGSGAPGGVFTPILLTGACWGALCSSGLARVLPSVEAPTGALAVLGMAALIAGTTHAPIMAMALLLELTGDFALLVPLLLATVASALVARSLSRDSMYTEALRAKGVPVDVGIEELTLRRTRVRDLVRSGVVAIREDAPLADVLQRFRETRLDVLYVERLDGSFLGRIDLHDVKQFLSGAKPARELFARNLIDVPPHATPEMTLVDVLDHFHDPEIEELPVLTSRSGPARLVGRLTRRDLVACLDLEVLRREHKGTRPAGAPREPAELPVGWEITTVRVPEAWRRAHVAELRRERGLTVLSIVERDASGTEHQHVPAADADLASADSLVVLGRRADIEAFRSGPRTRG